MTNAGLAKYFIEETLNHKNLAVIDQLLAPSMRFYALWTKPLTTHQAVKEHIMGLHQVFPDIHVTVQASIIEHQHIALHQTWRGTQQQSFLGVAASYRSTKLTVLSFFKLKHKQITEAHYAINWPPASEAPAIQSANASGVSSFWTVQ